jgi:hypothetical protein
MQGAGKAALANVPTLAVPNEIVNRAKTGFAVPTRAWMDAAAGANRLGTVYEPKGLVSRRWARVVLASLASELRELRAA